MWALPLKMNENLGRFGELELKWIIKFQLSPTFLQNVIFFSLGPLPFDFSQPPIIEGFTPQPRFKDETFKEKFLRKTKENPFVPIGCLGTAGALFYGLRAFHQGKTRQSQLLMRGRILAQGFTVVALVVGVFATALRSKQWNAASVHPDLENYTYLKKYVFAAIYKYSCKEIH